MKVIKRCFRFDRIKRLFAKALILNVILTLLSASILPYFSQPPFIKPAFAASCTENAYNGSQAYLQARVGGVSLDQAAIFLADMSDITGAYYDADQDRIVFVGTKNTSMPKFDKDDLAVAIRSYIFKNTIPAVSMEIKDPNNMFGDPNLNVLYYGGIEDTRFGQILVEADYKMKQYAQGYNENGQKIVSSVPGYKSHFERFLEKNPDPNERSFSRWWISPQLVSLKRDDVSDSFVFDQVKMQIETEGLWSTNDPKWNQAAIEFAQQQTDLYDQFAQETPSYAQAKQLGKIVAVVKWISDNNIVNNFEWAKEYQPKFVSTPREIPRLTTPNIQVGNTTWNMTGGVSYGEPNTYNSDDGTAVSTKNASEAVPTTKEDIHWTFTKDGQTYESVAIAASAFRSLGGYSTSATDLSFNTPGDLSLAFSRTYSSFSGGQNGIGRGWDMKPAKLIDLKTGWFVNCTTGQTGNHPWKLALQTQDGLYESFTYTSCTTGYSADDPSYHSKLSHNTDGTITATLKSQVKYIFDSSFKLKALQDKNGNTLTYLYDSGGKLASITDNFNHQITLSYNGQNLLSQISDWSTRLVKYEYDAQGNLIGVIDPRNNKTTYTYDANNKLTSIKDRTNQTVVQNSYTPEAKLASQVNPSGLTVNYAYDDITKTINLSDTNGRTSKVAYDDKARILTESDPYVKNITYTYGMELSPLTITDKNANKTTYTYDLSGNITNITHPDGKKITYEYNTSNFPTRILDGRYGTTAKETKFTYDSKNNLTQTNEASILTNFTYDSYGEPASVTNHLNQKTLYTRNTFGSVTGATDPAGNSSTFEYDPLDRPTKEIDTEGKVISYTYDSNNNVVSATTSSGTFSYVFDPENRLQKTTAPNNTVTDFSYNPSDNITSVKDAAQNLTSYGYDAYKNLISQQDALTRTTSYQYDLLNRQTQKNTPLGKIFKWEYDSNGNLTKRIDGNSQTTSYTYNNLNRLTRVTYPDTKTITYTYDDRGNLLTMVDSAGTTTYTYDSFDRLTKVTNPYSQAITYTYDAIGNLKSVAYPDSKTAQYNYNANNELTSVTDWNSQQSGFNYFKNKLLATKTLPNGISASYSYDGTNRLSSIEYKKSQSAVAKFSYERDALGNITKVIEEGSAFEATTPTPTPTTVSTSTPTPTTTISSPTPTRTPTPTPTPTGAISTPTPTRTPTPTLSGGQPDLIVTSINLTTSGISGYYNITIKVKNQGAAATTKSFRVGLYYDRISAPDTSTSTDDYESYFYTVGAGQEVTITQTYVNFSPGSHTIWAYADKNVDIAESNENNNAFGPYNTTIAQVSIPNKFKFAIQPLASLLNLFSIRPAYAQTTQYVSTFGYDGLNRIINASYADSTNLAYSYDKVGNRLTISKNNTPTSSTYNNDSEPTNEGANTYTYDLNGNTTKVSGADTKNFIYNFDNKLISYTKTSAPASSETTHTLNTATYGSIDIGSYSAPTFIDIDNDGDRDMFVGEYDGVLNYYQNNGTSSSPSFTLVSSTFSSIDIGSYSAPTFIDIDADGDHDLFIGKSNGTISFYRNNGTTSSPSFTLVTATLNSIDIGTYSSPVFADIDGDNDQDLFVGEYYGTIKYYKNIGTASSFSFQANTTLTTMDAGTYSRPAFADYDKDSDADLFIGKSDGTFALYKNTGTTTQPAFTLTSSTYNSLDAGSYSHPAFTDLDNDGDQDMMVGNSSGTLGYYTASPIGGTSTTTNYTYDGLGNRLQKTTGSTVTRYVNDVSGSLEQVLAETNGSNTIQSYYVHGLGLLSQGPSASSSRLYPLSDGLGNVRFITDASGNIVRSYTYDPFGSILASSGTANSNFKFSSEQNDAESGMYYLRARYYDPATGRFISRDPISGSLTNPQTQNPYAYVGNNPINIQDPSGLYWETAWDIANVAYDIHTCDWGALAFDLAAVALPIVPGGLTKLSKLDDVVKFVNKSDNLQDAAARGRQVHKEFQYPDGYDVEKRLKSGQRPDAVNHETKHVIELKPNNPQAIKRGEKQLERYIDELNNTRGGEYTGDVWRY